MTLWFCAAAAAQASGVAEGTTKSNVVETQHESRGEDGIAKFLGADYEHLHVYVVHVKNKVRQLSGGGRVGLLLAGGGGCRHPVFFVRNRYDTSCNNTYNCCCVCVLAHRRTTTCGW
jgi:hypothetical protein